MLEAQWKAWAERQGIPVPRHCWWVPAEGESPPPVAFDRLRPPWVLKAMDRRIAHKTEWGAVITGLVDSDALAEACRDLASHLRRQGLWPVEALLLEEMVPPGGVELLLGIQRRGAFGPVLVFGAGGVSAEALAATMRFAGLPLRPWDIDRLLQGPGGLGRAVERMGEEAAAALRRLLWAIGRPQGVAWAAPAGFEINPLVVHRRGPVAVDIRGEDLAAEEGQML